MLTVLYVAQVVYIMTLGGLSEKELVFGMVMHAWDLRTLEAEAAWLPSI